MGAGAIDSALNNHVALNYGARHMSWLHCCWGIGASVGPLVMGWALASPLSWHAGYLTIGFIQAAITAVLLFSLPLWKTTGTEPANADDEDAPALASSERPRDEDDLNGQALSAGAADVRPPLDRPLTNRELLKLPGAVASIGSFGFYCALEGSIGLWVASYLVMVRSIDTATAASIVAQFFMGITIGRLVSGFAAQWLTSENQIRIGQGLIAGGLIGLLVLDGAVAAGIAILLMGLGCAPIYPSIVALTPRRFGAKASQGLVSLQMACAYAGSMLVPPIFGLVAGAGGAAFIPIIIAALLIANTVLAELAIRRTKATMGSTTR